MSNLTLTWPLGIQSQFQSVLDSFMTNIEGRNCILYFPPIPQACPSGCSENLQSMAAPNTYWTAGNPQWLPTMQSTCIYCGGDGFVQVESSGIITMVVYDKPSAFNKIFPPGERHQEGEIVTRGFITDLVSVLNCTRMETYLPEGTAHYNFILDGEPRFPSKLVPDRYFYCLWKRV